MSPPFSFISLLFALIVIDGSAATILKITGREYNQRSYLPTNVSLTQYSANSKMQCFSQCARLVSTCNIAIFNPLATPSCSLYSESLTVTNLVPASQAITIDFGREFYTAGCLSSMAMAALSTYSIITMHELDINSDVYGPTIVCGSVTSSGSINFIKGVDSNAYPVASYGLEIHGQIGSGSTMKVYAGSLGLSTNFSRTISASDNKSYTVDGRSVDIEEGNRGASVKINPNLTSKCIKMENDLRILSNQLTNLPNISGNNISIPTSGSAPLIFYVNIVDASGIAAFYIDGNTTLNRPFTQNIQVVIDSSVSSAVQLVVINLSETSITYGEGNMNGGWLTSTIGRSKTIWNFKQATMITLPKRWMVAILAPEGSITTNSEIDGVVAVDSFTSTNKINDPLLVIPSCV